MNPMRFVIPFPPCPALFAAGLSAAAAVVSGAEAPQFPSTPPTPAAETAKSFHLLEGFRLDLLAAEPQVTSPVAIAYDEDGRAYVAEMNDYPYTDKAQHKPSQENPTDQPIGGIRLLEDTNGDGVFDKSSAFAEGLSWPTGVCCWKGGIFVTATPDLWYFKDTNGDGKADVRQKIYTGFKKLNVQAVMNNPLLGLDHRIYVAGGSNGATITRPDAADFQPVSIKRNDFSFDPNTFALSIESGGARFGQTVDDWGNRFLCNIRNPCQHVALPYRFLARNPYLPLNPLVDCAEAGDQLPVYRTSPPEPWREFRAQRWSAEGSRLPRSELVGAGVVTSSAGITVYRGDAYPAAYREFAFVADVAGNLFYRMKLVPDGITFKAEQVDGQKNFCTSDDIWFRPVNFANAPDGCLHVCDMYREVIEHPWSIPDDIHASLDLLRGRDRGRIYRMAPAGFKPRPTPKLGQATTAELVALLDHPNAWHRETAHRLLFERQDKAAVEPLRQLAREAKTPQGRVHALWSLAGLGAFGPGGAGTDFRAPNRMSGKDAAGAESWMQAAGITKAGFGLLVEMLLDPDPHVRRQAVRLRPEALLAPRSQDELYNARADVKRLLNDPDLSVRIEAIQNHTLIFSPSALPEFGKLCLEHDDQPQLLQAVLLAAAENSFPVFQEVLRSPKVAESPALQSFLAECAGMIGRAFRRGDPDAPYHVLKHLTLRGGPDAVARKVLEAMALALRRSGSSLELAAVAPMRKARDEAGLRWLAALKEQVMADIKAANAPPETLAPAIGLMPDLTGAKDALPLLAPFLAASRPAELQTLALAAIASYRNEGAVSAMLIGSWRTLSPALREQALTALMAYPDRAAALLDAVESQAIPAAQISAAARAQLSKHRDAAIASRAQSLLGNTGSGTRREVVSRYESALSMAGDAGRGAVIYEQACLVCHRSKDRGNDVGPNLATVQGWTPEQILTNILDPNREVSPNFALYVVETSDGRTLTGVIASETAGNLLLKRADGGSEEVLRSDIKSLTSPGISLMPEGLEAAINPQQMADLIAYLKS
jgi:putative membrane-bound dehydrogenase-like protein